MIAYRARHACGTEVTDQLPDGYPVDEGVGLYCPRCGEAFWHVERDEPAPFLPPQPPPIEEPDARIRRRRWRA